VIACLSRNPHATRNEIAAELHLSSETVKQHFDKLYGKFGVPEGKDRRGPLVEELRRRGLL
jgi:DNA-binding NarL/FixJ family response regulator